MRKFLIAGAVGLMAFTGQAIAAQGVSAIAPQLGDVGYLTSDRTDIQNSGKDKLDETQWFLLSLGVAGGIVGIVWAAGGFKHHHHAVSA